MLLFSILGIIFLFTFVHGIVKSFVKKDFLAAIGAIFAVPFIVFMISSLALGGSAAPEAVTEYEAYRLGHYYVCNHGYYREVSYEAYQFIDMCERVAIPCFIIGFILMAIRNYVVKKRMPSIPSEYPASHL